MEYFTNGIFAAVAIASIFCYYLFLIKPKTGSENAPPEAGGARPITGHLHVMAGGPGAELPHVALASLADRHGPAFTIRLGVRRILVVSSWELAREIFTTHDVAVSSRPPLTVDKHLSYDYAMLGFAPYGPYWREIRKLVAVELLSARRIELQRSIRATEVAQCTNELYGQWERERDGPTGRARVDLSQWIGNLNLNVVFRMVVGKRLYDGDNGEEARRCREVMRDFFRLLGLFLPGDALPFLKWLDLGGLEKKMKKTAVELDRIVSQWLSEHREKEYSGEDKPQDFMDVMLSVVKDTAKLQGQYDADTVIKATCQILINGGSDTTTTELLWALSLLLNNRSALRKAQAELDEHVGRERRVDESDISKLPYLQAIVKETSRLYPPGPLAGMRQFTKDCNVGGYHIPKGTGLAVNLWKLHRDPRMWPDEPLEFRPERFLDRHKNVDVKGQDFELIPFGAGRRICPGANFGLCMLHWVLANVLQAFDLSTVGDKDVDMTGSAGVTNMKATPLEVLIAPRLPPSLY